MNKQELIKAVIELPVDCSGSRPKIDKLTTLELIKLLKEPEKVTIPQLIAEKIEYCKETDGYSLFHAMDYCYNFKECADWLESNEEVFARAWLDGYELQGRKYVVTDGNHLYFKNYQEDIEIVILVDEQPGTMEYVKKFNTKEEAQKAADILGWKVQEVD
jgi:hypothetical protein|nr:MAG TPA: Protein of unknown function (DUF1642) [Caudoviricetes sp.]